MKGEKLRIAILSPPWFPVPPTGYGGIEWIVSLLADGLVEQGHEVTMFASGDSRSKATLASVFEHAPSELIGRSLPELRHTLTGQVSTVLILFLVGGICLLRGLHQDSSGMASAAVVVIPVATLATFVHLTWASRRAVVRAGAG